MHDIALQILEELFNYYIGDRKLDVMIDKNQNITLHNRIYTHIFKRDFAVYTYNRPIEILESDEIDNVLVDLIFMIKQDNLKFEVKIKK